MKKLIYLTLVALMLCGCAASKAPKATPNLTGEWKQINSGSADAYQTATISGDVIEIFWMDETTDKKSLYWSGTFVPPETADEPYVWESVNDTEKTDMALLASMDETKTFTFSKGQISYEVSLMGSTQTVKLEKE